MDLDGQLVRKQVVEQVFTRCRSAPWGPLSCTHETSRGSPRNVGSQEISLARRAGQDRDRGRPRCRDAGAPDRCVRRGRAPGSQELPKRYSSRPVRTVIGPLTIEVPRDRWGTFDPMTVGSGNARWSASTASCCLSRPRTLRIKKKSCPCSPRSTRRRPRPGRSAGSPRRPGRGWPTGTNAPSMPTSLCCHVHVSTLRTGQGLPTGFPVVSVVGATAPDSEGRQRRELLSLHAVHADRGHEPWRAVVSDLRRRQLRGVQSVVGAASAQFRAAVTGALAGRQLTRLPPRPP